MKHNMKAKYLIPSSEVILVKLETILNSVSGLGMNDGGKDDGNQEAQAPGRRGIPF